MAAAIKQNFDIDSELIKSSGGVFEITAEGNLIFSKKQAGRFPTEAEVIEKLQSEIRE
jgi:selenoprotein W-related protein